MAIKSNQSQSDQHGDLLQGEEKKQEKDKCACKKWPTVLLTLSITTLLVGGAVYRWQEQRIDQVRNTQQKQVEFQRSFIKEKEAETIVETREQTVILDNKWNAHYDHDLGVSFKFPKEVYLHEGCGSDGKVDMKVIKDENVLYLTTAETMVFENPQKQGAIMFKECVPTSLETLKEEENISINKAGSTFYRSIKWKIAVENIENEKMLESYIRKRYDSSECEIKKLEPTYQSGVYKVSIDSSSCLFNESCCINFGIFNRYYPHQKKLINFDIGQDLTFSTTPSGEKCAQWADTQIIDSVRFLE